MPRPPQTLAPLLALAVAGLSACAPLAAQAAHDVRYGRDVRPILAEKCFRCHGPDAGTREADLRLDVPDAARAAREGGAAIVPGDPERSLLWQRVRAADPAERMPPRHSGKPALTPAELAIVERWLSDGAAYEPHWAFVPPQPVAVPDGPAQHPVDRFLDAARRAAGLPAAAPASRERLARRVFLVLTGLPPTPAELDAFLADPAPDAYERLVDRLLGEEPWRTRHAEHLAGMWLDAARYADTSGIHMDAGRQAWAWRDWLIAALRDDLPFDRFVVEQLAGDLLPEAGSDQRIATGFLRHHVTTDEGGAIDEEYRVEYAAERVATVGSVFLGLTLACARCHDHKFDPIRQQDFFQLFAFFNSNEEPGLYSQSKDSNRALEPFLPVPTPAQQRQRDRIAAELAAAEQALQQPAPAELEAFAAWRAQLAPLLPQWRRPPVRAAVSSHGAELAIAADGTVVAGGPNPARDEHLLTLAADRRPARWLCLEALPDARLPEGKVGRAPNGNAVLQYVQLEQRTGGGPWRVVPLRHALADVEQADGDFDAGNVLADDSHGWAVAAHQHAPRAARLLLLADEPFGGDADELRLQLRYDSRYAQHTFGRVRIAIGDAPAELAARLPLGTGGLHVVGPFAEDDRERLYATTFGPETVTALDRSQRWGDRGWRFDAALQPGRAHPLPAGRNASFVAQPLHAPEARRVRVALGSDDGFQLFVGGALVAERRVDRGVAPDQDEAEFTLPAGTSVLVLKVVNTGGEGGFALRHLGRAGATADELTGDLVLALLPDAGEPALQSRLLAAWREHASPHHRRQREAAARLAAERDALEASIPRAMVMQEAPEPRPAFVLLRGDYDKPDRSRPAPRELPAMFGALPPDLPRNRLGLARWLVSADNPLLLRVQANRLWEFVFGTGLVRTSEDFGHQGEWPSHPELLDWLALELRARGHSVRALLRLLVTSAAFRADSRVLPDAATIDPADRLLAWFPRRRLTAEAIRDQALYAGGLLVERSGGPSVKPPQPPGLWQEVAMVQSNTRVYEPDAGDGRWRRSLYTYWKRACPPPNLLVFDAPTRESCTIRRSVTNTPLQALVLWNDEQFVAAARGLAARARAEAPGDAAVLQAMHRRCTGRPLADDDLAAALATLQTLRDRFVAAPADARALLAGDPAAAGDGTADAAALLLLANAFLSLDATLCID